MLQPSWECTWNGSKPFSWVALEQEFPLLVVYQQTNHPHLLPHHHHQTSQPFWMMASWLLWPLWVGDINNVIGGIRGGRGDRWAPLIVESFRFEDENVFARVLKTKTPRKASFYFFFHLKSWNGYLH